MNVGNVVRVTVVLAALAAAAGSASSTSSGSQNQAAQPSGQGAYAQGQGAYQGQGQGQPGDEYGAPPAGDQNSPPPPQQMEPQRAMGLWRSTFGAVKIEPDQGKGGLASGSVQGIWLYQRKGQDVVGYFSGNLRGNVLQFRWQEPGDPSAPLVGDGFLVFDPQGRQYTGRWWSDRHDRVGDWNGWRQRGTATATPTSHDDPNADLENARPAPAPRRTYRTQPVAPTYN